MHMIDHTTLTVRPRNVAKQDCCLVTLLNHWCNIAQLCNIGLIIQLHNLIGLRHDCKVAQSCSSTKDKENAILHLGHDHVLTNSGQYYDCLNMLLLKLIRIHFQLHNLIINQVGYWKII
jgi:hypothetical protein